MPARDVSEAHFIFVAVRIALICLKNSDESSFEHYKLRSVINIEMTFC
jgi:hypothetical protein